jgi:hypothetical protein
MKTLALIILVLMALKGHAICNENVPAESKPDHVPEWLQDWHDEFDEEERLKEEALQKRLRAGDPRDDEGREELA